MEFEEWFKQNSEYSYIGPEAEEAERAWNHQQAKIDALEAKIKYALEFTGNVHDENWQGCISDIVEALK